jgi:site-specific DNA-methyltransferase (cytosine-N4-specific)
MQIYDAMHRDLAKMWRETFRVLVDGGIVCLNIGDAPCTINGKFHLFPNHSRIIEHSEKEGFIVLPYLLWKKPTTKPKYKGKGAFLGSGFLQPNSYVTQVYEFTLIFRKGRLGKFTPNDPRRYESAFKKKQHGGWFTQIWDIKGTRQTTTQTKRRIATSQTKS